LEEGFFDQIMDREYPATISQAVENERTASRKRLKKERQLATVNVASP
jgi:hypothetical protein